MCDRSVRFEGPECGSDVPNAHTELLGSIAVAQCPTSSRRIVSKAGTGHAHMGEARPPAREPRLSQPSSNYFFFLPFFLSFLSFFLPLFFLLDFLPTVNHPFPG